MYSLCPLTKLFHFFLTKISRGSNYCKIIIIIIISSFYSLWSIGHPWRVSKRCDLRLSPRPHSMIFLYFLFRPLLSFATFSSAYLFLFIPEDSNPMQFSLLLLLYCKIANPKYKCYTFFLTDPCRLPKEAFKVGFAFRLCDFQIGTSLFYSVIIYLGIKGSYQFWCL